MKSKETVLDFYLNSDSQHLLKEARRNAGPLRLAGARWLTEGMRTIMTDKQKMQTVLEEADSNWRKHPEPLRPENAELLRQWGVSAEVQQFLAEFSFDTDLAIGEVHLDQANSLKKRLDWEDDFQRALQAGLLLVGAGSTGDPLALDIEDSQVGYLFHDYFWEEEAEDPRKFFIKLNCSLGQFFWNTQFVEDYPIDAYGAAEYTGAGFTGDRSPDEA
ncbi:hypothetical protein HER32_01320 [Hymenobacter sp. BT18]|uniref:hypothetical protein n=1 Tax=Hymenobacter sp. BT18 TaxID=2835648 RepID=UPI00143ED2DE|nr:hypothetical protein [Hymenobacter sp. BT18]QIX59903.1 hypothetical protein HER32_01320 [Hymenobacter sp. BT18]